MEPERRDGLANDRWEAKKVQRGRVTLAAGHGHVAALDAAVGGRERR